MEIASIVPNQDISHFSSSIQLKKSYQTRQPFDIFVFSLFPVINLKKQKNSIKLILAHLCVFLCAYYIAALRKRTFTHYFENNKISLCYYKTDEPKQSFFCLLFLACFFYYLTCRGCICFWTCQLQVRNKYNKSTLKVPQYVYGLWNIAGGSLGVLIKMLQKIYYW